MGGFQTRCDNRMRPNDSFWQPSSLSSSQELRSACLVYTQPTNILEDKNVLDQDLLYPELASKIKHFFQYHRHQSSIYLFVKAKRNLRQIWSEVTGWCRRELRVQGKYKIVLERVVRVITIAKTRNLEAQC